MAPSEPCILPFGCMPGGGAYPAFGAAIDATTVVLLPAPMFDEGMAAPLFRNTLFRILGARLVDVMLLVEEVATPRLDTRLAAALPAHLAQHGGAPIRLTHQQLADELGTVREIVVGAWAVQPVFHPGWRPEMAGPDRREIGAPAAFSGHLNLAQALL